MDEPRTSRLELQTNQGVGCLRPGDGYLCGPYIHIHVTLTMGSRSGRQVLRDACLLDGVDMFRVAVEVLNGTRPAKPEDAASLGFTSGLWEIVEQCWLADSHARPTLGAVLSCLSDAAPNWDDRREVV